MARAFRLIRAGGDPAGPYPGVSPSELPVVTFSEAAGDSAESCAYSVIIGNNGSGKSRLLGNIASEFVRLHRGASGRGGRSSKIDVLDFSVDGHPHTSSARLDDFWHLERDFSSNTALPSRVIAVALTSVDKFPLEPSGSKDDYVERELTTPDIDSAFYCYVGMRDRTNRASVSALLYRALEGLDSTRSGSDNKRLRNVFDLLGYSPEVHVRLTLGISADVRAFVQGERELGEPTSGETRLLSRLRIASKSGRYTQDWLQTALIPFIKGTDSRHVEYTLTFGEEALEHPFDMEALRLLRRLGALTLSAVVVRRLDGLMHDLRDASSGQISMLTVFLSVAAHLRDGSLVLIDEPETSLHPEWQTRYINLMQEVFSDFTGCHFVFSTHSPLIVADMPKGASIYSMDRRQIVSSDELIGRSPDFVMARAFDVVEPSNLYLRDVLAEALRLVGERKISTQAFTDQLAELVRLSQAMEGGEQIKLIVKDLQNAKAELAPHGD